MAIFKNYCQRGFINFYFYQEDVKGPGLPLSAPLWTLTATGYPAVPMGESRVILVSMCSFMIMRSFDWLLDIYRSISISISIDTHTHISNIYIFENFWFTAFPAFCFFKSFFLMDLHDSLNIIDIILVNCCKDFLQDCSLYFNFA